MDTPPADLDPAICFYSTAVILQLRINKFKKCNRTITPKKQNKTKQDFPYYTLILVDYNKCSLQEGKALSAVF